MGCWNGTCGLTNLPIRNGDKIVLFILKYHSRRDNTGGGIVYPTDLFSPITLPLYGEYNDYGGIENITRNGDEVFKHFNESVLTSRFDPIEINEEEFARQRLDGNPKDIEELVNDYIERGVYKNLGFMMVLESVLDKIKDQKREKVDLYINDAHKFSQIYKKELEKNEYLFSDYEDLPGVGYKNKFASFWRIGEGNYYSYKHPFINKLHTLEVNQKNKMIDSLVDLIMAERILGNTRKFWTVQAGSGSQNEDYEDLALLAKITLEREIEVMKEREEY